MPLLPTLTGKKVRYTAKSQLFLIPLESLSHKVTKIPKSEKSIEYELSREREKCWNKQVRINQIKF